MVCTGTLASDSVTGPLHCFPSVNQHPVSLSGSKSTQVKFLIITMDLGNDDVVIILL